jgi:FkbM family methyltransferase
VKAAREKLKDLLYTFYTMVFGSQRMQRVNNVVLDLALRARGYENSADLVVSGEQHFFKKLITLKPVLCLDIGANVGVCSKFLLENTGAIVIAFEPHPKPFSILERLRLTYPTRFECFNVGVGDKQQDLLLNCGSNTELSSFCDEVNEIPYVNKCNFESIKVPVITLDSKIDYILGFARTIDLLKIDTEGYEYEVLLGATKLIERLVPKFITIEFNWHHLFRNHTLRHLGQLIPEYCPYQLLPRNGGLVKVDLNRAESNIFLYANFVFIRRDIELSQNK